MSDEPMDFSKLDPLLRDYIVEMREMAKKSKAESKELALERDAYKQQLEEMKKRSARDMSEKEYRQAMRDMRKDLRLKEYDQKLTRITPKEGWKDVKTMTPEEYKEYKMRVTGRRIWK